MLEVLGVYGLIGKIGLYICPYHQVFKSYLLIAVSSGLTKVSYWRTDYSILFFAICN